MSYLVGELSASITGDTRGFDRALDTVRSAGEKAARDISSRFAGLSDTFQSVGRRLSLGLTAPITAAGYAVARMGGDFQSSMNRVQALTGSTGDELKALSDQAKELGISTQFSASQAADAMGFLAMAGFDANQILGTLPDTLNLAAASGMDLAQTADVMSNIMQGYGLATEEAARASDVLTKAFTSSNTDLGQLAEAMKYAGPVAAGMGVEFEEAAAAIGMMGNAGIQGSMAGTSLRNALSRLAKPAADARRTIAGLGLSVDDLNPTTNSLTETIGRLSEAGADTSDMLTIFGQRAGPAMQALIDQGADALSDFSSELRDAGGAAEEVASVQMRGFQGAMLGLKSAVEGLAVAVGESGVLQFLEDMARRATEVVRSIADLSPSLLRTGAVFAGVAAAIGPLLFGLGALMKALPVIAAGAKMVAGALALLTSPIALAVAGIAGLVAAGVYLYRNFESVREITHEAWGAVAAVVSDVAAAISEEVRSLVAAITQWWSDFGPGIIEYTRRTFENVLSVISIVLNTIGGTIRTFLALIRGDWSGAWSVMQETGEAVWSALRRIIINTVDTILAAFQRLVGWLPKIGESFAASIGSAREAVASIRPVVVGATEDIAVATEALGEEAERTSDVLEDMSINLAGAGESASGAREAIDALAASLSRIDAIYDAFTGRDHLDRMREQARALTTFLEDAYAGDLGLDAGTIAQYRVQLDALNVAIGETLAARARMGEDPLTAESFLPGLDDASVRLDGLTERLGIVYERAMTFGEAAARILADDVSMAVGRVVEGVIMMEDGFRSLSDTLKSFGEMAQRIFARLIADITAAVTKAAALKGIGAIFGVATGGFGGLVMGALGFGGARAMGGPVMSGQAYVVGERGPELFVPPAAGKIIPNHALGGGRSGPINVRAQFAPLRLEGDHLTALVERVVVDQIESGNPGILARAVERSRG